jgi:alpha-amylase
MRIRDENLRGGNIMKYILAILLIVNITACVPIGNSETSSSATPTQFTKASITATTTTRPTLIVPTLTALPSPTSTQTVVQNQWWNDTVFYEISVRSFFDSNNDGIGDFNGLIEKLDYLNDGDPSTNSDLGVTGIWLMPIHPSPSTHGYDVIDYYSVNPEFGSLEDFKRLVDNAHRRGMRIIIDLVLNHTSDQNPWFIQSQDPDSSYRNWYIWSKDDPGWLGAWNQQVWYPLGGAFYYAFFWKGMPDLNYNYPEVTLEMENVARFWLEDVGIDGFRLDAIGSLIEEGSNTTETKSSHEWMANYKKVIDEIKPDSMTIGEVWREDPVVIPWVANHEVDLAFEFDLSFAILSSINNGDSTQMIEVLKSGTSQFPEGQYGTFLTNHDMARVMTQLGANQEKAKAAASLYFSLPGVPFVYFGEEIGLVGDAPDEMGRRPMQWTSGQYAGFSEVSPWKMPDIDPTLNVAAEISEPDSILSHYHTLISLRNSHHALQTGRLFILLSSNQGLFACLRTTPKESVLVMVNLTNAMINNNKLSLASSDLRQGNYELVSLMGGKTLATLNVQAGGGFADYIAVGEISPFETIILELK